MVKYLLIFLLFIIKFECLHCQNFEGKIIYENTFESKVPKLSATQLKLLLGDKQEYYIKGARYKSLTNGSLISLQTYDPVTNKIYTMKKGADTLYWNDASKVGDSVLSFENRNYPAPALKELSTVQGYYG